MTSRQHLWARTILPVHLMQKCSSLHHEILPYPWTCASKPYHHSELVQPPQNPHTPRRATGSHDLFTKQQAPGTLEDPPLVGAHSKG